MEILGNTTLSGPEEITNFNTQVEEQKELYTQQISAYTLGLNYGSVCCDDASNLRNFQRRLNILDNYDTRDIYNCSPTLYGIGVSERFINYTTDSNVPTGRINLSTLSAGGLNSISVSKKEYTGSDVENYLLTNFSLGSIIRLTNTSSLGGIVTSESYIITAMSDNAVKVNFSLIPLSSINTLSGVDFNFNSHFIDISVTATFFPILNRNTTGALGTEEFKSSPSLTTTNFSIITKFTFSTRINNLNVGHLILYSDPSNYAIYNITNADGINKTYDVSIITSLGTFSTNTSVDWYVSHADNTAQFLNTIQVFPGICTQDTTIYNNLTYTEIKNLLNS